MKFPALLLAVLLSTPWLWAAPNPIADDTKWTHSWTEGEDATSSFYYFLEVAGNVVRARILWNGGAHNDPAITDYFLGGSFIKTVTRTGSRKSLPDLLLGRDAKWKTSSECKIACANSKQMLVPPPPDKTLTDKQRIDLYNLIHLLSEDRRPHIKRSDRSITP